MKTNENGTKNKVKGGKERNEGKKENSITGDGGRQINPFMLS